MPKPFTVDAVEKKVVGPDSPVGKAVRDLHRRYLGGSPIWYKGDQLGGLSIEEAYLYPPVSAPVVRADC